MRTVVPEVLSKVKRIRELSGMGFNTPRMLFFPAEDKVELGRLQNFLSKHKQQKLGNIRTYARIDDRESYNSTHLLGVSVNDIYKELTSLTQHGLNCMVDLETPGDGLYAGCILINSNKKYLMEYCYKQYGGAMVRMANDPALRRSLEGVYSGNHHISGLEHELASIIRTSFGRFSRLYQNVTLEWCWMKEKCGELNDNMIFWEYRNLEK